MSDSRGSEGERALRLAQAAARVAGIDPFGAKLLRARSSSHVELPRAAVVARVESAGSEEAARNQVRIARELGECGAPVARLVAPQLQPFLFEDGSVTLWHRLVPVATPDFVSLGRAVRAVHEARRDPPRELPEYDPFFKLGLDLAWPSPWTGSAECRELHRLADSLPSAWLRARRTDPLGRVVIHGDVHQENAIVTDRGLVLIDLEMAAVGPASWDFVALEVGVERYGLPRARYREFVDGYGDEPGDWPGLAVLCRLYELQVAAWAMRCSASSPRLAAEAAVRIGTLLGREHRRWTLL